MTSEENNKEKAVENYIKALGKGIKKVMSKMGISTLQGYMGAQVFEVVGLSKEFIDKYFSGENYYNVPGLLYRLNGKIRENPRK